MQWKDREQDARVEIQELFDAGPDFTVDQFVRRLRIWYETGRDDALHEARLALMKL